MVAVALQSSADVFLSSHLVEMRARLRRLMDESAALHAEEEENVDGAAQKWLGLLAREGALRLAVPRRYGGEYEEVCALPLCLAREELARSSSLADTMLAMQGLGSYPITLAGSEEQKERYLPPVARGEKIATFAITEPDAGSDVASLTTRAEGRAGRYVLNGVKRFISNAGLAHTYVVFAKTDPGVGTRGISAFVVEAGTPGLKVRRMDLIAPHPIGEVVFENCAIPEAARLGTEGDGFAIATGTLALFRVTVGAAAVGMAQRALEEALAYARKRIQFGRPIAQFQAIRFMLADMATELQAARLLVYQGAWSRDNGQGKPIESSMAKLYATEMAQRVIDQALQIHGGMGVVKGTAVERLYREVRVLRIYEGTSEIQKLIISNELLRE
ncbi:MAG: acyl-CoA dehydrogenase family protein [Chloroflexi bacterium]|nr:acyl-CoA dehydrogenase family protein [Chloroflexota bacterium]